MYLKLFLGCGILLAVCAVAFSYFIIRRAKRQIQQMAEALEDIRAGNGNRRILSEAHELTAPLAYGINEIVRAYEEKLAAFSQAEETNKQLMTSLSHDVRTPLTTLIGYLDAVHRNSVTGQEREAYVEIARQKAHDLKDYIAVLFDWFKLNSDEFTLRMERTEAAELTRDILIAWIPILEEKQVVYAVSIPQEPLWVRLDRDGYGRILNNLMQNALAHSQAAKIAVTLFVQGECLKITLADNGVGMEREDLEHIFERLYKCDKGRAKKGNGLGLSIARQLTEKMGGQIRADSGKGKGTTFTLSFPLQE